MDVPYTVKEADLKGPAFRLNRLIKLLCDHIPVGGASTNSASSPAGVLMGTYADRSNLAAGSNVGSIYVATDQRVVYQSQYVLNVPTWTYVAGTIYDTLANRPTLATVDTGVLFDASDTYQQFRWSGSAWVEITMGNLLQIAYASSSLVLTTAYQDITGATITLTRAGRHLITASFCMVQQNTTGSDAAAILLGLLMADGTPQTPLCQFSVPVAQGVANISQQWSYVPATTGKIVLLRAKKNSGTGTSFVNLGDTSISALWLGP